MPERERWSPDDQLIAAVRSGTGRRMGDLAMPDRCWVVAGLTLGGMTADEIADRLGCSLRLVRAIRAEDMTQVCLLYQRETEAFANELRLGASATGALARDLAAMTADRDRLRAQLDRVLDARLVGEQVDVCGAGHLMTPWNTYWRKGRRWCRECHATRQRDYRLAKKLGVPASQVRRARADGALDALIQSVLRAGSTHRQQLPADRSNTG